MTQRQRINDDRPRKISALNSLAYDIQQSEIKQLEARLDLDSQIIKSLNKTIYALRVDKKALEASLAEAKRTFDEIVEACAP